MIIDAVGVFAFQIRLIFDHVSGSGRMGTALRGVKFV
jgi:hypothetical protein